MDYMRISGTEPSSVVKKAEKRYRKIAETS